MKRACYILSMAGCLFTGSSVFLGGLIGPLDIACVWMTMYGGSYAAIGLVVAVVVLLIVFISLSYFKNGKYKYVSLCIWLSMMLPTLFCLFDGDEFYVPLILNIVFMIVSFLCAKGSHRSKTNEN